VPPGVGVVALPQNLVGFWLAMMLMLTAVLIGVWDVYAIWYLPAGSTVSWHLRQWSQAVPLIPFLLGIIVGHLFFPMPR